MKLYNNNAYHKNTKLFHWPSVFENYKILKNKRDKNQQSEEISNTLKLADFIISTRLVFLLKYLAVFFVILCHCVISKIGIFQ